jgi:multiple sugar transport system substrate-binding protein
MSEKILKGITWGHTRGLLPMQAIAQRFSELHPGVEVLWQKRSLQEFADFPIEKLTDSFDLLEIDHPWVGTAAATQCVLPLDIYFKEDFLQEQLESSVGFSHQSYNYANHQWALAIDAAAPAASYRADLLDGDDLELPSNWQELLKWAAKGKVAVPAIPIDLLMNFYSFCLAFGETPFSWEAKFIAGFFRVIRLLLLK